MPLDVGKFLLGFSKNDNSRFDTDVVLRKVAFFLLFLFHLHVLI